MPNRILILLIGLFCFIVSKAQVTIDTSDYYNFYYYVAGNKDYRDVKTEYLTTDEIASVASSELKLAFKNMPIIQTEILLSNGKNIELIAYCPQTKFGFLLNESCPYLPSIKDRSILHVRDYTNQHYGGYFKNASGRMQIVMITEIPENIFLLGRGCYFYQYPEETTLGDKFVTKEIALSILRQDIRKYLSD